MFIEEGSGSYLSSDRVIAPGHQVASASTTLPAAPEPSFWMQIPLDVSIGTCSIPLFAIHSVVFSSGSPLLSP